MNSDTKQTINPNCPATAELAWVDEFITNVRPYIFVRLEDNLLIQRPNKAQKLNPSGARILKALLDGSPINNLLTNLNPSPQQFKDISLFLLAVKHQLEGKLDEFTCNPAVESRPFEMTFSSLPVLSEIALTYRCNLSCAFCYAGCGCKSNAAPDSPDMTADQAIRILHLLYYEAKVPSVSFTGGEPTLIPFLPRLIREAKNLGMRVNLITNGTLITRDFALELAEHGLDSAQVSLEGTSALTHDALVRSAGAFEKSVAAVHYLKNAGIATHSNTTLTRLNMDDCSSMPAFVRDTLECERFSMNLIIPAGSGAINSDLVVRYSEIGPYIEAMILAAERAGVEFMWYSPVPMCMFNSVAHGLGNKGCSACDGLISIAPDGNVLPCSSCPDPVGNILNQPFHSIWQSGKARYYREKSFAFEACKACSDFYMCHGACPLYWQKMGYDEIENYLTLNPDNLTNHQPSTINHQPSTINH